MKGNEDRGSFSKKRGVALKTVVRTMGGYCNGQSLNRSRGWGTRVRSVKRKRRSSGQCDWKAFFIKLGGSSE